ncbi:MAG: hypothetical protein MUF54_20845 [Polyangiaceae bacterium]|jgi:hypothetical protein|nr:hypothetical protein [Polyangiaceae bacterium]
MNRTDDEAVARAAAGVLALTQGPNAAIEQGLAGMAPAPLLARLASNLTTGDRSARARALASCLARVAMDLDEWSLK